MIKRKGHILFFIGIVSMVLVMCPNHQDVQYFGASDSTTSIIGHGVENITSYPSIHNIPDSYNESIESQARDSTTSWIILTVENTTYIMTIENTGKQNNISIESEQSSQLTESNILDRSETSLKPVNNNQIWTAMTILLIVYLGGIYTAHNISRNLKFPKARKRHFNHQI